MKNIHVVAFATLVLAGFAFFGNWQAFNFGDNQNAAIFEATFQPAINAVPGSSINKIYTNTSSTNFTIQAKIPVEVRAIPGVSLSSGNISFAVFKDGVKYTDYQVSRRPIFADSTIVWTASQGPNVPVVLAPVFSINNKTRAGLPLPAGEYSIGIESITWRYGTRLTTFRTYSAPNWRTSAVRVGTEPLTISRSANSPQASTVFGDTTDGLDDVELLRFDLKADNEPITIREIIIPITKATTTNATTTKINEVTLRHKGGEGSVLFNSQTGTARFGNLNFVVPANTSETMIVLANFNGISVSEAKFTASLFSSGIDARKASGDTLLTSDKTGQAIGSPITIKRGATLELSLVSTVAYKPYGDNKVGAYSFHYKMKAVGGDIYLANRLNADVLQLEKDGVIIARQPADAFVDINPTNLIFDQTTGNFLLKEGLETSLGQGLIVTIGNNVTAGNYRAVFPEMKWDTSNVSTLRNTYTINPPFKTSYLNLN